MPIYLHSLNISEKKKLGYLETAKTHLNEIIKDNECF